MAVDALKQLEQQVDALIAYCQQLQVENQQLEERNRVVTGKLQKLLAQFKALEE